MNKKIKNKDVSSILNDLNNLSFQDYLYKHGEYTRLRGNKYIYKRSNCYYCIYTRCSTLLQWCGDDGQFLMAKYQYNNCMKFLVENKITNFNCFNGTSYGEFGSGYNVFSEKPIKMRQALLDSIDVLIDAKSIGYEKKYLVVNDYSRLTRNFEDGKSLLKLCQDHGIIICSATETPNTTETEEGIQKYLEQVKKAQDWLLNNKEKQKVGYEWVSDSGGHAYGRPRYGLKVQDGILVKDNDEIKVIRAINVLKNAKKKTLEQIVDYLNNRKIQSDEGGNWTITMVENILNSKKRRAKKQVITDDDRLKMLFKEYKKLIKKGSKVKKTTDKVLEIIKFLASRHKKIYSSIISDIKVKIKIINEALLSMFKEYIKVMKKKRVKDDIKTDKAVNLINRFAYIHNIFIYDLTGTKVDPNFIKR